MTALHERYRERLAERLRPQTIDVPGFERGSLAVRLLSDKQIGDAKIAAYHYLERECKEAGVSVAGLIDVDAEVYDRERVIQIVHRAFVDAEQVDEDDPTECKPAFPASWVRDLDAVTVQTFLDAYLEYQDTKGIRRDVSDEAMDELVASLREPGGEAGLVLLDAAQLRSIVMLLVRRGS